MFYIKSTKITKNYAIQQQNKKQIKRIVILNHETNKQIN